METRTQNSYKKAIENSEYALSSILKETGFSWKFIGNDTVHELYDSKELIEKDNLVSRINGEVGMLGWIINEKNTNNRIIVKPHFLTGIQQRIDKPNYNIPANIVGECQNEEKLIDVMFAFFQTANLYFLLFTNRYFFIGKFNDYNKSLFTVSSRFGNKLDRISLRIPWSLRWVGKKNILIKESLSNIFNNGNK